MDVPLDVNVYLSADEYESAQQSHILQPSISFFNNRDEITDVAKHMGANLDALMQHAFPDARDKDYASRRFIYAIPAVAEPEWRKLRFFDNTLENYVDVNSNRLRLKIQISSADRILVRDRYFLTEKHVSSTKDLTAIQDKAIGTDHLLVDEIDNIHIAAWAKYLKSTCTLSNANGSIRLPEIWIPYEIDITTAKVQKPRKSILQQIFS